MKIYDVRHGNRAGDKNQYCGPSAISAITGMSSGEAARLLRHVTGKRSIKGTSTGGVRRALGMCGVTLSPHRVVVENYTNKKGKIKTRGINSLAKWLTETVKLRTTGRVFLLVSGNHWQVISGRRYVCGQTGEVVSITDKKVKRRAKVTEVYECIARNGIIIPAAAKESKVKSMIRRATDRSYAKFRSFARDHGLQYSVYPEGGLKYITIEPTPFWPQGLETLHYDFDTTLGRLEHCLETPSAVEDGYYSE
jgi:hypothetical protein